MTPPGLASFAGANILVTGARGFIGSHLCERLQRSGADVYAVTRKRLEGDPESIRWIEGNLTDFPFVRRVLQDTRPDYIYHLSGYVTGLRDSGIVVESYHSLLTSTIHLLAATVDVECKKIVLAGSLEEPDQSGIPGSPYAAAKWAARGYAEMFRELYGVRVVNPKIFMVYGPGQQEYRKLIPYVTLSFLRNRSPKLSSGRRAIDWIYIDDVVDALLLCAMSENSTIESFDIGTGNTTTVREIVELLAGISGSSLKPVFSDMEDRPMERVAVADPDSAFRAIDWKPKTDIRNGLERTVRWYEDHLDEIPV